MGKYYAHGWIGKRFGMLVVLRPFEQRGKNGRWWYECKCDCGAILILRPDTISMRVGRKSCKCSDVEHGMRYHALYSRWNSMKDRCLDPKSAQYHNYGGRGITIHPDWIRDASAFIKYCESLPNYDPALTIDRIDVNGNYEPGNIRFATPFEQSRNKRVPIKLIQFRGEMLSIPQIRARYNPHSLSNHCLYRRIFERGMEIEEALSIPSGAVT